ncbi:MFS transporter [Limnohabitans sp.]|uniref:MFS transporter n=1 Tax=Limnohabitans sp. TaxID=1907725 RepID=UPI002FDD64A3
MHPPLTARREFLLLLSLAGIQFTHLVDFVIMMPLGPQLTILFDISFAEFGLLVSAYTVAAGLSGLFATTFIDRFDRKHLLLTLYVLFALTTVACGIAPTYGWLMAARIASGFFGGVLSAMTQTIIGDVVPFERRGRATGIVMTSFSLATVAGVPAGLLFANLWGWHSAFFGIGVMCLAVGALAYFSVPRLDAHVAHAKDKHVLHAMGQVLGEPNQRMALLLSASMMFAAFTIIPYITLYLQNNQIMAPNEIPWLYFCGGAVTFFSGRWVGGVTDRVGKRETFQRAVLFSIIPMVLTTLLEPMPLPFVLLVSTSLFFAMNARMIPGMALLTSAANPKFRGTFMSLNGAVQSFSMGAAAWVGGMLLQRSPNGQVTHFWLCALVATSASLLAYVLSKRVSMHA